MIRRRAAAIVLEGIGLDRIGDEAAVGELADAAGRVAGNSPPETAIVGIAAVGIGGEPVLDREVVAAHMQHGEPPVGRRVTPRSGRRPTPTDRAAASSPPTGLRQPQRSAPLKRNGVRNRHSSSRPALPNNSGPVPKVWMRPTAPGSCATHSTTAMIQSMPSPISRQNTASNPSGKVSTPRMPIGMIQAETTGMARRLASTPYGARR